MNKTDLRLLEKITSMTIEKTLIWTLNIGNSISGCTFYDSQYTGIYRFHLTRTSTGTTLRCCSDLPSFKLKGETVYGLYNIVSILATDDKEEREHIRSQKLLNLLEQKIVRYDLESKIISYILVCLILLTVSVLFFIGIYNMIIFMLGTV